MPIGARVGQLLTAQRRAAGLELAHHYGRAGTIEVFARPGDPEIITTIEFDLGVCLHA